MKTGKILLAFGGFFQTFAGGEFGHFSRGDFQGFSGLGIAANTSVPGYYRKRAKSYQTDGFSLADRFLGSGYISTVLEFQSKMPIIENKCLGYS